jgi:hypothetical protein
MSGTPHRNSGPAQYAAIDAAGAVPVRTSTTRHQPGKLRRTPAGIYAASRFFCFRRQIDLVVASFWEGLISFQR